MIEGGSARPSTSRTRAGSSRADRATVCAPLTYGPMMTLRVNVTIAPAEVVDSRRELTVGDVDRFRWMCPGGR